MFLSPPRVVCVIISANLNLRPIVPGTAIEKGRPLEMRFCRFVSFVCYACTLQSGRTVVPLICVSLYYANFQNQELFATFTAYKGVWPIIKITFAFGLCDPIENREILDIYLFLLFFFWSSIFWPVEAAKVAKRRICMSPMWSGLPKTGDRRM
jgi:hypothetical protein